MFFTMMLAAMLQASSILVMSKFFGLYLNQYSVIKSDECKCAEALKQWTEIISHETIDIWWLSTTLLYVTFLPPGNWELISPELHVCHLHVVTPDIVLVKV
jgi:hypothetical protein